MCLCVCGFTRYNHSQYPVIRPCWKVPPFLDDFPFGFHPRLKVIHFRPLLITLKITIPPFSWLLFPYVFPHKTTYVWDFCPVFWHLSIFCTVGTWFIIVPMTPTARKGKPDERAAFHAPLDPHGCWGHVYLKMGFGDINGIWMVLYIYRTNIQGIYSPTWYVWYLSLSEWGILQLPDTKWVLSTV